MEDAGAVARGVAGGGGSPLQPRRQQRRHPEPAARLLRQGLYVWLFGGTTLGGRCSLVSKKNL